MALSDQARKVRRRADERGRYSAFIRDVEPDLNAGARVHRFAEPPILGPPAGATPELAVCVDATTGSRSALERTLASVNRQPAAGVVTGWPPDALSTTRAPWVALVSAGAVLADGALERLGEAVALAAGARLVSCDEDELGRGGRRRAPHLRSGPAPDFLRSCPPEYGLVAVDRSAVLEAGAPDLDLLALAGAAGEHHAHVPQILCHRAPRTRGPAAKDPDAERARPPLAQEPSVEVVMSFKDKPELLERSVGSLLAASTYDRLGIRLVDNDSGHPGIPPLAERLSVDPRVCLDRDPRPFNFSAINNSAAARSAADILVFLNNDTEVISPGWLEELLEEATRPEVGAVAPMLLYPDGRVQHAGVALGIHGWAGHPFAGLRPYDRTPFGAASDGTRNWLAVSAACMMVERRKFLEVGGFDEEFAVGGGDVDLCLRLTAAGYRSLCVPHVRLLHDESASRDPAAVPPGDFTASRRSYGAFRTVGDPFYHPALTVQDTTCRLRSAGEPPPPP